MNKKNIIAVVLARGGSKRLKNKNLQKIGKTSLLEITINFAIKLKFINDIVLSTDSKKMLDICKRKKILTPGLRPSKLSKDKTSSEDVIFYLLKWYEKKYKKVDGILLLQPTTPYRDLTVFNMSINKFRMNMNKVYVSVSKLNKQIQNVYNIQNNLINRVLKKKYNVKNLYILDGSLYLISKKNLLKYKTFVPKVFRPVINKKLKYSIDIDFPEDLKFARLIDNRNF